MSKKSQSDAYQCLSEIDHALARPDMYIGSCTPAEHNAFICDIESDEPRIIKKDVVYPPGILKIFDEIILNAFDQTVRTGTNCTDISVEIDQGTGTITITNDGEGIPVVLKEELGCYIPEMLFGKTRSGSNFNDVDDQRLTGGRNGMGASLANIFSVMFRLETVDAKNKLHYVQTWTDHMKQKSEPEVKKSRRKPFTRISFIPDLNYFKLNSLTDDITMLMKKRLIDIGYTSGSSVKTSYDDILIKIKKPEDYMKLYTHPADAKFIVDDTCERWSVGIALSEDGFQHSAFVNGIHTSNGGTHVDHVANMIAKEIIDKLKTKKITVKPMDVKNKLFLFVRSAIINPVFDSQSKERLKTPKSAFGSEFVMSSAFRAKLLKSDILKSMSEVSDSKMLKDLSKTNGTKVSRIIGMDTLEDATWAGTAKAPRTRLILTEGLSARTFAFSALRVIGKDLYGIFPLKGKLLNVRNVPISRVTANEEISSVTKILGLRYDMTYETPAEMKTLRYGGVISLADADADGFHICGLIINYFHHFWPALIANRYLSFCITPIVKVYQGKSIKDFYTLQEYTEWLKGASGKYRTKYFKGLGTSTPDEARASLKNIDSKLIAFDKDTNCDEYVSLAFNNKRADDRKDWLINQYDPDSYINRNERQVSVSDFINYELSHFSTYDCARSIPNVMDGLKPSQRKILYVAFKCLTKSEMKVAQFSPKVAEQTDYHHGEQSLMGAVIGMATDYVGSNNINLLLPLGAFGTRLNGNDAASPRYIFTKINPIAMEIFNPKDSSLLTYLKSDDLEIEPEWYAPVLPMILVNGTVGIGTGFSSTVLKYNPKDIAEYMSCLARGTKYKKKILPWYRGFNGLIEENSKGKYTSYAVWKFIDAERCLHITDLPITVWTDTYKSFCEALLAKENTPLQDVLYDNTEAIVDIKIIFKPSEYRVYSSMDRDILAKEFKLSSKLSSRNMYLFDSDGRIRLFDTIYEIMDYYFEKRMKLYVLRREALISQLSYEMLILTNKAKFIRAVRNNEIDQKRMTDASLLSHLESNFDSDPKSTRSGLSSYDYLIDMGYRSFTLENANRMDALVRNKMNEMKKLKSTTSEQMWVTDLSTILSML